MRIFSGAFILLAILAVGICAFPAHAQQARFNSANELLHENRYADALEIYKEIENDGYESGALWLNMGISYSQIDSLGMSKFYFLKALEFQETEGRAQEALNYINSRFSRQSAVLPQLPWIRFLHALNKSVGISALVFATLFFLYLGTAFLISSWFRKDLKKVVKYGYLCCFSLAFLILFTAAIIQYQQNRYGTGVMVARQGQVYQQPDDASAAVNTAYEGYSMQVDYKQSSSNEGWYYVRLENGMYGWVRNELVKVF